MQKNILILGIILTALTSVGAMCSKGDQPANNNPDQDLSVADKLSGTYTGTGKKLPDNIFLGTFNGCVSPPGWESNFMTGLASATITKQSDSTVTITLKGGPFSSPHTNSGIKVTQVGTTINLPFGYFDVGSGFLSVSINDASSIYTPSPSCLQGMPYYSGGSILNNGSYSYYTHGRSDFSGTKQ